MCGTADSLMLTQYVRYSSVFNADTICVVSRQFNDDTICVVQQTV